MRIWWSLAALLLIVSLSQFSGACDGERIPVASDTSSTVDTVNSTDTVQPPEDALLDNTEPDIAPVDLVTPEDSTLVDIGEVPEDVTLVDSYLPDIPPPPTCPDAPPEGDATCSGDLTCTYGEECCCGDCFDSLVCNCTDEGTFVCFNTDACYGGGWCGQAPCCLGGGGYGVCKEWNESTECMLLNDQEAGKCLAPVKSPSCWSDADCGDGGHCEGAMICPCNADCDMEDTPGQCKIEELPPGCCFNDEDCDKGTDAAYVCGWNEMSSDWGRCMWLPQEGGCWDDSDCTEGKVCNGAFYCPCDALCGAPDIPGTCMAPDEKGDVGDPCGQNGGDCKEGLSCCYPCGIPDCIFECTEPCDAAEPWCEGGCPLYA
jgi:hypothetical protein